MFFPTAVESAKSSALAADTETAGNIKKRKAESQDPPSIEEDICKGVVRRAASWRVKYNPKRKRRMLHVDNGGFHMLNRDGIACNGDRCDDLLEQLLHDGTDPEEAQRDNFVVSASGRDDPSREFNIEVCSQHPKLALPVDFDPNWFSLSHSHLMQICRNINNGAKSDVEGITDQDGCLSLELVRRADQRLARLCTDGFSCEMFPHAMEKEEPEALYDISIAANIKHGTHLMETEMQCLVRLGRVCSAEQSAAQNALFDSVRRKMTATMPKMALSENFVDIFALAVNLGASEGPFLNELADFHGQWVNPKIRKIRLSTLGLLGTMAPQIIIDEDKYAIAPLIVALIKGAYAASLEKYMKDEYLEYLSKKDVEIKLSDADQKSRLLKSLATLHHFHVACKEVIATLSRGVRIQFLGAADVRIANAYLERPEETSALAVIGFELHQELANLCGDGAAMPAALPWFEPPSEKTEENRSEPLGPSIMVYDEDMKLKNHKEIKKENEIVCEVIPARASGVEEAAEIWKSEMVLALLQAFRKFGEVAPPGDLTEVRRIKSQVSVHAKVDIEEGALIMVPVVRTTQGVSMITRAQAAKRWDSVLTVASADKDNVWVLLKQMKLPPKQRKKNDDGQKDEVYHAWIAKRVNYEEAANCTIKWYTMNLVKTFGGYHSDANEIQVPVFTNTQSIPKDAELTIFAKKLATAEKKIEKVETWQELEKKKDKKKKDQKKEKD